ncbi:MAG: hypothetical protein AAF790_10150 [Planctomycetota bacterium]
MGTRVTLMLVAAVALMHAAAYAYGQEDAEAVRAQIAQLRATIDAGAPPSLLQSSPAEVADQIGRLESQAAALPSVGGENGFLHAAPGPPDAAGPLRPAPIGPLTQGGFPRQPIWPAMAMPAVAAGPTQPFPYGQLNTPPTPHWTPKSPHAGPRSGPTTPGLPRGGLQTLVAPPLVAQANGADCEDPRLLLQNTAFQLDSLAHRLEVQSLYEQADAVRLAAGKLRAAARRQNTAGAQEPGVGVAPVAEQPSPPGKAAADQRP